MVSAWNVGEIDERVLLPCHVLFQFSVDAERLSCHVYQRSVGLFLGVPFTPRELRASHPLGRRSPRT
ncbi:thymidylate synthase [Rathayibacter agropyri]